MRLLHISNDFAGSKVHSNLVKNLESYDLTQFVYCPVRDCALIGNNQFLSDSTSFIYSFVIRPWHKYLYHVKKNTLYRDLKEKINLNTFDLIHAATLFSDGSLAYEAYKEFRIPYIVSIRNTDINAFAKLQPHTWNIGRKILLESRAIVFISKALQLEFEKLEFVRPIISQIAHKFLLQVNGIENEWLKNINTEPFYGENILYIGDFSANKNIVRLMNAIKLLRREEQFCNLQLTIIGGGKDKNNKTLKVVRENSDFVSYIGRIQNKETIQEIMRHHALFAMPSIHETFGLVYIEALTQNLPVIYSLGQGIDQLFDYEKNPVGVGVNPLSTSDIERGIKQILLNRNRYSNRNIDFSQFNWNNIAKRYFKLYESILNHQQVN